MTFNVSGDLEFEGFEGSGSGEQVTKVGTGTIRFGHNSTVLFGGTLRVHGGTAILDDPSIGERVTQGPLIIGDGIGGPGADVLRIAKDNLIGAGGVTIRASGELALDGFYEDLRGRTLVLEGGRISGGSFAALIADSVVVAADSQTASIDASWQNFQGPAADLYVNDGIASPDLLLSGSVLAMAEMVKLGSGSVRFAPTSGAITVPVHVQEGVLELGSITPNAVRESVRIGTTGGLVAPGQPAARLRFLEANQLDGAQLEVDSDGEVELLGTAQYVQNLELKGARVDCGAGTLTLLSDLLGSSASTTATIESGELALPAGVHTFDLQNGASAVDFLTTAGIVGAGSVSKIGTGTWELQGASTFSGGTEIKGGTLLLTNAWGSGLGSGPVTIYPYSILRLDGGTLDASDLVAAQGSVLDLQSGTLVITGGTFRPPDDPWSFGSSNTAAPPDIHLRAGAILEIEIALRLAEASGTSAVLHVEGHASGMPTMVRPLASASAAELVVGGSGSATLEVVDGGAVELNGNLVLAESAGSAGQANLSGSGTGGPSRMDLTGISSDLVVAELGTASLSLAQSCSLGVARDLVLARGPASSATLALSGTSQAAPSVLVVGGDFVIGGDAQNAGGTAIANLGEGNETTVAGDIRVWGAGTLSLTGTRLRASTLHTGTGSLWLTTGHLSVDTVSHDLIGQGVTLAPGLSTGVTQVGGNLALGAGALEIELGGLLAGTEHDIVQVAGEANLAGTTLQVRMIDGFTPAIGSSYTALVAAAVVDSFAAVDFGALDPSSFEVVYFTDRVEIHVVNGVAGLTEPTDLPVRYALARNHPNPFNPRTSIDFDLPRGGRVLLDIHDAAGRRIATLADRSFPAGRHSLVWNGRDHRGRAVAAGVYLYRIRTGEFNARGRMTLVR